MADNEYMTPEHALAYLAMGASRRREQKCWPTPEGEARSIGQADAV